MIVIDEYQFFQYVYLWVNRKMDYDPEEDYMRIQLYAQMMGWA